MQRPFVNWDGGRFGKVDYAGAGDAGEDAAVERGCEEGAVVDGEHVGAGRLQHTPIDVYDERQSAQARLGTVKERPVPPLVGAEPVANGETVQCGWLRPLTELAKRDLGFESVTARHDIDPHHAIRFRCGHVAKRRDCPVREQLRQARLQPDQVGLQFHRAAVEDEQRLEDALCRVGSPVCGHGGDSGSLTPIGPPRRSLKTLLIDNYDSFTYNLFQLLAEVNGEEPLVVRNDAASWDELARLGCDNVVISPGPGRPGRVGDFGVCAEAIRRSELPLLGVCIGHQGLGALHGAAVVPAPEPMHGRISAVLHDDAPLFAGIPREFAAVRYHSLCVEQPLPAGAARHGLDERRRADGARALRAAALGRPVPSGVGLHGARPAPAGELPRFERSVGGPAGTPSPRQPPER